MAFHANELPDIPTIGVWKFDRTEFDDANLQLQQKEAYRYDLIAKLEYADTFHSVILYADLRNRIEPLRQHPQPIESVPVAPVSHCTNVSKSDSPSVQGGSTPQDVEATKLKKQANTKRKAAQEPMRAINTRQRTLRAHETEKASQPQKEKATKDEHQASPVQKQGSQAKARAKAPQKKATRPAAKKPNVKAKQVTKTVAQKPALIQKQAPTPRPPSTQRRRPKRPLVSRATIP